MRCTIFTVASHPINKEFDFVDAFQKMFFVVLNLLENHTCRLRLWHSEKLEGVVADAEGGG